MSNTKLSQDFDQLMGNYKRMTRMLLDGLAPNVPQEQRDELRKLFTPFVSDAKTQKDGAPKPERGGGGALVE